jgi:hypothetical protein
MSAHHLSRRAFLGASGAVAAAGVASAGWAAPASAAPEAESAGLDRPLRELEKPNLVVASTPAATIHNSTHRVSFYLATWDGGQTYLRKLEMKVGSSWRAATADDHLFDEQWVVLSGGPEDSPYRGLSGGVYYYSGLTTNWISFDTLTVIDNKTVELAAATAAGYALSVRWTVAGPEPEVRWRITASQDGQYVIGYQSFDIVGRQDVDEVLCGTRQHARYIESALADNASELMAPMTLIQRQIEGAPATLGLFVRASDMRFEHLLAAGLDNQPYGMSLLNESAGVQPVAYAPQAGQRAAMTVGQTSSFGFGICAKPVVLSEAYRQLARHEYQLADYRQNIYGTSLTDAMYNLIDLVMVEPDGDGTGDFAPSPSGWWERAKGFGDPENYPTVRQATAGVMLSAYLLTGDHQVYDRRARPLMEYQLSRTGISWTPILGHAAPGNSRPSGLCALPRDASTLVPLWKQTHGQSGGIRALALQVIRSAPKMSERDRTPMNNPLEAYALTQNPAHLAELHAAARLYAKTQVLTPYDSQLADGQQYYFYSKAWTELFLAYELTGDQELLDAARLEALRFVTQLQLSPVPSVQVDVPIPPVRYINVEGGSPTTWTYPRDDEPTESVPAWMVSTNGMSFEALTTYRNEGFSTEPTWAAFMLRLAEVTSDTLLRDTARNLIIGRYSNYPGYKYWQYRTVQMHPDFPLEGPEPAAMIYYTHIAAHLGMTIDFLVSEHVTRSGGKISFPAEYEADYVFFRFHTYGHEPGVFYGDDKVWLYMPKGVVSVDNPLVNWIVAEGNGALYLSLTNTSDQPQRVTVSFDADKTGIEPRTRYEATVWSDNTAPRDCSVYGGTFTTVVSPKGITAIKVTGAVVESPLHVLPPAVDTSDSSYHFDDASPLGKVRGLQLVRPDRSGYDAYIQVDNESLATLRYSTDEGATWSQISASEYPNEWTIGVDGLTDPFSYQVVIGAESTEPATLRLPPAVTGVCPTGVDAVAELSCAVDTTAGDVFEAQVRVYNGTGAALQSPAVTLTLSAGWTCAPSGPAPVEVEPGGVATWAYDVTVPVGESPGLHALGASATWAGGAAHAEPASVEVLTSVKILGETVSPAILAAPGDAATVTATVVNLSPVARSGHVTFSVYSTLAWSFEPAATVSYDLAGRSSTDVTVTLHSPANAQTDVSYGIYATLDDGTRALTDVSIAADTEGGPIIVTIDALPPDFSDKGPWFRSGLAGYNGGKSLYSPASPTGELGGQAIFRPQVPEAGVYEVSVWYPTNPTTTTAALFTVHHADGDTDVTVNEQENAADWFSLGTFNFATGNDGFVRLTVTNADYHRISAVRLTHTA